LSASGKITVVVWFTGHVTRTGSVGTADARSSRKPRGPFVGALALKVPPRC
jgi:hypothetical protein